MAAKGQQVRTRGTGRREKREGSVVKCLGGNFGQSALLRREERAGNGTSSRHHAPCSRLSHDAAYHTFSNLCAS